uniref:DUF4706 domain-containing protein n=1 Tax=Cacopsylla melanoneura TaxID=428564 RepID=A0A8D8Q0K2_9HEMI
MAAKNKDQLFEDYVKSCGNVLADRILEDIHLCKQDEKYESLGSEKDKNTCIDNSLIYPGIVKKYAHVKVNHQYTYPVLYKHCWFTKSQLDLYENLSKEYKYPNDSKSNSKADDGNKKSMTLTKIDDKFKLELINELKLKQFSNDQINTASQKANNQGLINKIKNKVNKRSKDEDKQNLVDVKVHQIVPSKPKAPPPPPPTVKIKTTPITSPIEVVQDSVDSTETNDASEAKTKTTKNKPQKTKKMPAPPPPAVHKTTPKDEIIEPVLVELSPQEQEDIADITPVNDNTSEYSVATTTNLDSPTKSFCSMDDIPKTGFDFLDNW